MKLKIVFCTFLIVMILPFDLISQNQANKSDSFRYYYTGAIGEKYKIGMDLTCENSKLNGLYSYNSQGKTIEVAGDVDSQGNFILNENAGDGSTGTLKGNFGDSYCEIKGEWTSQDGKKKLPLNLQKSAEYKTVKDNELNVSVTYPVFTIKSISSIKDLNDYIADKMKGYLDSGRAALQGSKDEANEEDSATVSEYSYENNAAVDYISESISSIICTNYLYSGGAHPTFSYSTQNYYYKSGMIKEITLAELFKPNIDYAQILSDECIKELKENQAPSIVNGEITDITEQIQKGYVPFTILQAGLKFYFSPYVIGSYADGPSECVVKYSKIKNSLNLDGVLSEFAKNIK
jgi:hypothetical protein